MIILCITLFSPIILASTLHMFVVKYDLLSFLKIPINQKLFGANKTIRGILLVPLMTGILASIIIPLFENSIELNYFLYGVFIGLGYCILELPNSFIKRRLNIPSGGKSKEHKALFVILDRFDSSFGVILAHYLMTSIEVLTALKLIAIAMLLHFSFSFMLYKIGVKKEF